LSVDNVWSTEVIAFLAKQVDRHVRLGGEDPLVARALVNLVVEDRVFSLSPSNTLIVAHVKDVFCD